MRYLLLMLFSMLELVSYSQGFYSATGTRIIKNLSWKEVKRKAKSEHKYILIDCNSTWCGPCKYLENRIFPMDTIGKLLNDRFLVVSVQFDSSANDNSFVKSWYSTAVYLKNKYNVTSFPTEIILDENAVAITKFCGVDTDNGVAYIYDQIALCFLPQFQYFKLENTYSNSQRLNSEQLRALATAAAFAGETKKNQNYSTEYFKSLDSAHFNTKENYEFIVGNLHRTTDSLFGFVLENYQKIDSIVGYPIARVCLSGIIYFDDLKWKTIFKNAGSISTGHYVYIPEPNWNDVAEKISRNYSQLEPTIMFLAKLDFYNLEDLYDSYFDLILSHTSSKIPIEKEFTPDQIFEFLNKILELKSTDRFWLTRGQDWVTRLTNASSGEKVKRYKQALESKLNILSIP